MKLNPPKFVTWLIALVLGVVGLLLQLDILSFLKEPWGLILFAAGFALLLLATLFKGL